MEVYEIKLPGKLDLEGKKTELQREGKTEGESVFDALVKEKTLSPYRWKWWRWERKSDGYITGEEKGKSRSRGSFLSESKNTIFIETRQGIWNKW
jgi:hypothetical protein